MKQHAKGLGLLIVLDQDEKKTLTDEDFEMALCDFKPVSIRNVELHKPGDQGWSDVGGLDEVKRALVETLHWPVKVILLKYYPFVICYEIYLTFMSL